MNISITPTEQTGISRRLQISVPPETVAEYEDKAARKYASQARLPGFRPGKAPPSMVRKRFAELPPGLDLLLDFLRKEPDANAFNAL